MDFDPSLPLGDCSLLDRHPTVVLNSRQSKTPRGDDPWVRNTIEAVKLAIHRHSPIVSSIGMNTWELSLWATGESGGNAVVILPAPSSGSREKSILSVASDFGIEFEKHAWLFVPVSKGSGSAKSWWAERDRLAFEIATCIMPVSVRPKGRLLKYMETGLRPEQSIHEGFRTEYENGSRRDEINLPEKCFEVENWPYVTHWTCRRYGPWPGETSADYYRAVAASRSSYARSASATLKKILAENLIRASGNHIRKSTPVVAFTALKPSEALPLMRWRKRYVRPTFEPYGIAIHYRAAMGIGIRPVTYLKSGGKKKTDEGVSPDMIQGWGTGDWPKEKEWRAIGDVDLSELPEKNVIVLVPDKKEAEEFRSLTHFEVLPLDDTQV